MISLFYASLILISLYFLVLFVITYLAGKKETFDDFSIGSRNIGLWQTVASLSSGFRDGAGVVVWGSFSILFGLYTMWLFVALAFALLLLSLTAKFIRKKSEEVGAVTLSDYLERVIGPKTSSVATVIILMTAFLYAASQLNIAGTIFSSLLNISPMTGILISMIVVAMYLIVGGYKTVIRTDMFQWLIILVIIIMPFLIRKGSITELPFFGTVPLDVPTILAVSLISFFAVYSYADVWQRIFSAKDAATAKRGLLFTIPVYFFISSGLVFLGMTIGTLVGKTNLNTPFLALFSLQTISPILLALLGVFILASMMSTFDTQVFVFAQTVSRNLVKRTSSGKKDVWITRLILLVTLAVLALIASTVENIIRFLFSAVTVISVLAPVLFFHAVKLFDRDKKTDVYISIILVVSTMVYGYMFFAGLFGNFLFLIVPTVVSLLGVSAIAVIKNIHYARPE